MATSQGRKIPITQVTELARKGCEQLVVTVRQGRQLPLDAAKTWVSAVAMPDRSRIPDLPGFAQVAAITTYPLDVAAHLLDAQQSLAGQLASVLVPSKAS
jgi:hypothetical protein